MEVGNQPILFTILDQLLAADFSRAYISVNYKADMIEEAVGKEARYSDLVHCSRGKSARNGRVLKAFAGKNTAFVSSYEW
jgi:NDP-sugar pyrophosphorylase family protein